MRVEPLPGWARVVAGLVLAAIAVALLAGIRDLGSEEDPVPTRLLMAHLNADGSLGVGISSCNKNPSVEVVEGAEVVTITAYAVPPGIDGEDCADGAEVTLEQPLGERLLVDGSNGNTVPVTRGDGLQAGDQVQVLLHRTERSGRGLTAALAPTPEALSDPWTDLGAVGPSPQFDADVWSAVVLTTADSLRCSDGQELALLDGPTLRIGPGPGAPSDACEVVPGPELLVVLVPTALSPQVDAVEIRDQRLSL